MKRTCVVMAILLASCVEGGAYAPEPVASPRITTAERVPRNGGARGGVVARDGDWLFVADEDRHVLRVLPLPVAVDPPDQEEIPLPGPPAAVLVVEEELFVTIRDPGLVLKLVRRAGRLEEVSRAEVPTDAWGVTLTADGKALLVSSAWSHAITRVERASMAPSWTLNVPREPRAIVVLADRRTAYVTHLTGAALTRIDGVDHEPVARRIAFPAAPLRNPDDAFAASRADSASLAYAAVLSPSEDRLYVPRQALGATGKLAWNGQPTVDVMLTADETPLARRMETIGSSRSRPPFAQRDWSVMGVGPLQRRPIFAQPRDVVYRRATDTLLVVSEGRDMLVELDAKSVDPSAHWLRRYELDPWFDWVPRDERVPGDSHCGAPSGIALSDDEATAYVWCRSTATLAVVELGAGGAHMATDVMQRVTLAADPLDAEAALGRRLFYDGRDTTMSFGFGCAGCHPDGRDDGHVWHEVDTEMGPVMRGAPEALPKIETPLRGVPRQTPMLAGRMHRTGPFGWRGESKSLEHRILKGFALHHWYAHTWISSGARARATALAAFLRRGLPSPPLRDARLSELEERGRELFVEGGTGCASCHVPEWNFTDGRTFALGLGAPQPQFVDERVKFRTPSLAFVGGTAPYLHDGSAPTLRALLANNHDRMGITSQLDDDDRDALVAYLHALGGPERRLPALALVRPVAALADVPSRPLSSEPTEAEWASAIEEPLARPSTICEAHRVREWVRVRCRAQVEGELIGGSPEGVRMFHSEEYVRPRDPRFYWSSPRRVDDLIVVFPTRPGDRRLIQGVSGLARLDVGLMISESWLDGEPAPTIVAF